VSEKAVRKKAKRKISCRGLGSQGRGAFVGSLGVSGAGDGTQKKNKTAGEKK